MIGNDASPRAGRGDVAAIRKLAAARADLDARDAYGRTPLHVATFARKREAIGIVLGDGGKRHQETLRALIAAGANLQLADRQGRTPLVLARGRGYAEMVGMLEAASARR